MFVARFKIAKLFGIPVQVDLSWFIIVALITWSLAKGVFPQHFKDLPETTYWMMGLAGALGLFVSILLHELGHSLVAQRYGLPIEGIAMILAVDRVLDMFRTAVNITSDSIGAAAIAHSEGETLHYKGS